MSEKPTVSHVLVYDGRLDTLVFVTETRYPGTGYSMSSWPLKKVTEVVCQNDNAVAIRAIGDPITLPAETIFKKGFAPRLIGKKIADLPLGSYRLTSDGDLVSSEAMTT